MANRTVMDAGYVLMINGNNYAFAESISRFFICLCESASFFPIQWRGAHLCHCEAASYVAKSIRSAMSLEQRETFLVHGETQREIGEERFGGILRS